MRIYPRPDMWKYRPVPPYEQRPRGGKLAGLTLLALIASAIFGGHALWTGKSASASPPALAAVARPPDLSAAPAAPAPAPKPDEAAAKKEPSRYSYKGAAGIEMDFAPRAESQHLTQQLLRHAQADIKIQAFQLRSPIMQAEVLDALQRRVRVEILVDDAIRTESKTVLDRLKKAGAAVHVNARSGAHHDKTIIVDGKNVLVGSINFSRDAKDLDFTNVMVISNPDVAHLYLEHWNAHWAASSRR